MGAREQVTSFEISHFVSRILSRPTKSDCPPLLKHVSQLVPARAPDVPSDLSFETHHGHLEVDEMEGLVEYTGYLHVF